MVQHISMCNFSSKNYSNIVTVCFYSLRIRKAMWKRNVPYKYFRNNGSNDSVPCVPPVSLSYPAPSPKLCSWYILSKDSHSVTFVVQRMTLFSV